VKNQTEGQCIKIGLFGALPGERLEKFLKITEKRLQKAYLLFFCYEVYMPMEDTEKNLKLMSQMLVAH
jgi:hypothetical protein